MKPWSFYTLNTGSRDLILNTIMWSQEMQRSFCLALKEYKLMNSCFDNCSTAVFWTWLDGILIYSALIIVALIVA